MRSLSRDHQASSSTVDGSLLNNQAVLPPAQKRDFQVAVQRLLTFVRSEEFVSRFEKLQLINPATVQQLLKSAVAEALGTARRKLDAGLEKTLLEGAEQAFVRKYAELRSSAKTIEGRILKLQACLSALEDALREQTKSPATSPNLAPYKDILFELEQRFTRSLRSTKTTAALEESLGQGTRRLLVRLFRKELGTIKKRLELDSQKKVVVLESEVRRLTAALESAAKELKRRPQRPLHSQNAQPQPTLPERTASNEAASMLRLSLLKELVQVNRDIRQAIAATLQSATGGGAPHRVKISPPRRQSSSSIRAFSAGGGSTQSVNMIRAS